MVRSGIRLDGAYALTDDDVRDRVARLETELEALRRDLGPMVRDAVREWGSSLSHDINASTKAIEEQMAANQRELRDLIHGKGLRDNGIKGELAALSARLDRHALFWKMLAAVPATVVTVYAAIKAFRIGP